MTALPKSIVVRELLSSRYQSGQRFLNKRPESWDDRISGIDVIKAADGNTYNLESDGQQSPPAQGWNVILREGDNRSGYRWTLYGIGAPS